MRRLIDRREFVRLLGLSGAALVVGSKAGFAQTEATQQDSTNAPTNQPSIQPSRKVPKRKFGKTGIEVPILALGGIFDIPTNQIVLERAYEYGVTYWDTAYSYQGGRSEQGMGMFFERHPERRKEIFLVTKTGARNPHDMTAQLNESLERLKTDYVDLYFLHGISDPNVLSNEIKEWAEKAKAEKKIRFFGFSTHANMEVCLEAAAKLGWIDGIMLTYNYRVMNTDRMKAAIEAAAKAGIGLTAMKTQAQPPRRRGQQSQEQGQDPQEAMVKHFTERGFTPEQARLKIVWEDEHIASICSAMYTISVLQANVAAALDKTQLSWVDKAVLFAEAEQSKCEYCAGCTRFCEAAVHHAVPIGDIMRALMYRNSYGDESLARETLSSSVSLAWWKINPAILKVAEQACPNRLPIASLVQEAATLIA